jgi:hypothetical protein
VVSTGPLSLRTAMFKLSFSEVSLLMCAQELACSSFHCDQAMPEHGLAVLLVRAFDRLDNEMTAERVSKKAVAIYRNLYSEALRDFADFYERNT